MTDAECPRCGEPLTTSTGTLAGGVTRADVGAILTCRDCGAQWVRDSDGGLAPYRWT
jgi:transcription elongation factor Elf1